jgi:hypothetical protein
MDLLLEQTVARMEKNQKLLALYGAMMTVVREMLAARALGQDTQAHMDRLEVFHTREIQIKDEP